MRAAVLVFPGSNCDRDIATALRVACGAHVSFVDGDEETLPEAALYVLPGGFSWGDYLRCGAMAARQKATKALKAKAEQGARILGICNGFQILIECGLLPGALVKNKNLTFICKKQNLKVENNRILNGKLKGATLSLPIAHSEGRYIADDQTLRTLAANQQIAMRYGTGGTGSTDDNPNGSVDNIAALTNRRGTILGMMPHPERALYDWHGSCDGKRFLQAFCSS
ncbi:MAG: phosphoribosylformylglycinamidine synthase subunit PurQ [Alphaproteobacteria bacterium GM202ARS2]|nr:phosphoribosylformylglycinamidine synthase subunit PurQ [Alphaproteobacteria bacterium GM202ARS2]